MAFPRDAAAASLAVEAGAQAPLARGEGPRSKDGGQGLAAAAQEKTSPVRRVLNPGARGGLAGIGGELARGGSLGLESGPVLDRSFDGKKAADGSLAVEVSEHGPAENGLSRHEAGSEREGTHPVGALPGPADKPSKGLPFSYNLYLATQFLYALGQEATSLIAPLYAYSAQGLAFAVASQASFLLAILPGSFLGERWVKRFDAKKVYLAGNLLHGLFALSVPVLHALTGVFSPVHFLASNLLAGFVYGALRGVAEKEIAPRILGQEDRERLDKAGSLFYAAFEGAELTAALVIAGLIPLLGLNPAAAVMSALMLASAVPIWFMKLKREKSEGGKETGGTEKSLPKMLYLPYLFTVFS
ncbi:MAG: MFS transporter, partial [Elusimicrobiota bacterium]